MTPQCYVRKGEGLCEIGCDTTMLYVRKGEGLCEIGCDTTMLYVRKACRKQENASRTLQTDKEGKVEGIGCVMEVSEKSLI